MCDIFIRPNDYDSWTGKKKQEFEAIQNIYGNLNYFDLSDFRQGNEKDEPDFIKNDCSLGVEVTQVLGSYQDSKWCGNKDNELKTLQDSIHRRINAKLNNLEKYKSTCNQVWLALYLPYPIKVSPDITTMEEAANNTNLNTNFDRIYLCGYGKSYLFKQYNIFCEPSQLPLGLKHKYYLDLHALSIKFENNQQSFFEFMKERYPQVPIDQHGRM